MKVALFVYGSNYFYMFKKLGWDIDYKKLLAYCSRYGTVVDAYYYTGDKGDKSQDGFFGALQTIGYVIKTKPLKTITDNSSGQAIQKANLDIEIALDMINTVNNYDVAVLASGDGDFRTVLELIRSRGKSFEVISSSGSVARELKDICGMHYVDISTIRPSVEKKNDR